MGRRGWFDGCKVANAGNCHFANAQARFVQWFASPGTGPALIWAAGNGQVNAGQSTGKRV